MANSLLDFVMSLVRDPDAAARFAENPDQAIFDANLTNVTSADVSNLIPVVTESLGGNVPTVGGEGIVDMADNVWASGAATAAFDAFGDQVPVQGIADGHTVITDYVDSPDALADAGLPGVVSSENGALQFDEPVIDDLPVIDLPAHGDLSDTIIEVADMDSDPSGYDFF
ncbi:Rv0340 family IniB-related protein [Mycobacterium neglectum]|jgi:hypothetical protein|uniref:Rv0340 family IniB-related protein n=1 Tax=Mycobacterium neglectum TaxID=242737 RepID=UPI000BFEDA3C|nr:IniB N-terminal domain-containing protein [Mycobacterium neglectum]